MTSQLVGWNGLWFEHRGSPSLSLALAKLPDCARCDIARLNGWHCPFRAFERETKQCKDGGSYRLKGEEFTQPTLF